MEYQGFWICNQIFKFCPYIAFWPEIWSGNVPNLDLKFFLVVWADSPPFYWFCDKWMKLDQAFYIFLDPVIIDALIFLYSQNRIRKSRNLQKIRWHNRRESDKRPRPPRLRQYATKSENRKGEWIIDILHEHKFSIFPFIDLLDICYMLSKLKWKEDLV